MNEITHEMQETVAGWAGIQGWNCIIYAGGGYEFWPDLRSPDVLLKWVVPKLREGSSHCDISFGYPEDGKVVCDIEISGYKGEPRAEMSWGEDELPGSALFLAIFKLVEAEDGQD